MQTTKQQLLTLLKRAGSVTIEEAAGALAVASMTARQHLVGLEKDGLVQADKVRRATGRPHYLYTLTSKGEELFPRRYDLLAQIFLEEVGSLSPDEIDGLTAEEKRSLMIRRAATRLAERYRLPSRRRSLEERVAAVTDVLHLIGGFAEWVRTDDGFEIRDYNCVFARLVPQQESGCEWHTHLLTQLLRWPVQHEVMVNDSGGECCRYLVSARVAEEQREGFLTNV
jgi:predicted ArsR family transcriptional regulator